MTNREKIKLFFQSLKSNSPRAIQDAAAAVGDYSDITETIIGYIEANEIKGATTLIADLSGQRNGRGKKKPRTWRRWNWQQRPKSLLRRTPRRNGGN